MEDTNAIRSRHGQMGGKGFWWIEDVLIEGKRSSLRVMFGARKIGDKACYRAGEAVEVWFSPEYMDRDGIIQQGKTLLEKSLDGKKVTTLNGTPYSW